MHRLQQQWSPVVRAPQKTQRTYQEAMRALNGLVSNEAVRATAVKHPVNQLDYSREYSRRIGMTLEDLDQLSVIHVAGTKGKGSTCAYTESILRNSGFKTGFFSSPHLMDITERIRINGSPISKDKFTEYFWHVYSHLDATKDNYDNYQMPCYFQFLTTMAFYVFLKESVDVTILEVGIGGQYDCTNIVRVPVVCGITALGFDHQSILGSTLDSIAWQKAGIFKPKTPAVTLPQPPKAMSVLMERAQEIGCPLYVAPEFQDYGEISEDFELGSLEPFQQQNISLALQLSKIWLYNHDRDADEKKWFGNCPLQPGSVSPPTIDKDIPLLKDIVQGIKSCEWLGRAQTVKMPGLTYYLDGAHTLDSMREEKQCKEYLEVHRCTHHSCVVCEIVSQAIGSESVPHCVSMWAWFNKYLHQIPRLTTFLSANAADCFHHLSQFQEINSNLVSVAQVKTLCCQWFEKKSAAEIKSLPSDEKVVRILIFNLTGSRKPKPLLSLLKNCVFDIAVFTSNLLDTNLSEDKESSKCKMYEEVWHSIDSQILTAPEFRKNSQHQITEIFPSINDAILWCQRGQSARQKPWNSLRPLPTVLKEATHVQVLITGSIHLVGGVLSLLKTDESH